LKMRAEVNKGLRYSYFDQTWFTFTLGNCARASFVFSFEKTIGQLV